MSQRTTQQTQQQQSTTNVSQDPKSLKEVQKLLVQKLNEQYASTEAVKRQGTQLVIPQHMTYRDAAQAILQHEKEQESVIETTVDIKDVHPDDALVCFNRAVKNLFGSLIGKSTSFLFFTQPPQTKTVSTGYNQTETVPVSRVQLPGVPIEMTISPASKKEGAPFDGLRLTVEHAKKFLPLVKTIEEETRRELRENSIFKGKAFDSDFNFINPKVDESRVVYNPSEKEQIDTNILTPIRNRETIQRAGIPVKRGVLLEGPFGTGKTLTALRVAKAGVDNGWTFVNVKPGQDFLQALETARRYEPAVVFVEDVDVATESAERNTDLNQILETFDGLVSKDSQVMVVLTTNRVQAINRAMLRPGRLDSVIHLGELEGQAVIDFIHANARDEAGNSVIEGDLDEKALIKAAEGMVPAFLAESIKRAKMYAITRTGGNQTTIRSSDIVQAIEGLRPQLELMAQKQEVKQPPLDAHLRTMLDDAVDVRIRPLDKVIRAMAPGLGVKVDQVLEQDDE